MMKFIHMNCVGLRRRIKSKGWPLMSVVFLHAHLNVSGVFSRASEGASSLS